MIIVKAKGRRIEYVLKEYRQRMSDAKIHKDLRSRMEYEKPSSKRRREKQKAERRNKWKQ